MKRTRNFGVVLAAVLSTLFAFGGNPCVANIITSTFDTDSEGWVTFQNGGAAVQYFASGGNPGGYIGVTDMTGDWGYLQAPPKFLVPAAYNGTFSFDLKTYNNDPSQYPTIFSVRAGLVGNGLTLIDELTVPTESWQNYSFSLNEMAGWEIASSLNQNYGGGSTPTQTQFQGVLANLSGVFIAADYTNADWADDPGVYDQTFVDNVQLTSAVPEPSTFALLGAVAVGLGGWAWQRRRVA